MCTQLATEVTVANGGTPALSVVFDTKTLKFTFTAIAGVHLVITFGDGGDTDVSPSIEFGLRGTTAVNVGYPVTSTRAVDVNGSVHALYLRSNLPTLSVFDSRSGGVNDVLAKVPINTNPGGRSPSTPPTFTRA